MGPPAVLIRRSWLGSSAIGHSQYGLSEPPAVEQAICDSKDREHTFYDLGLPLTDS